MLNSLCITNFAIVEQLELDFEQGMTALTGETGAGKSILIDALMLALGERADTAVIRPKATQCDISACFSTAKNPAATTWLHQHDLTSATNELILRRVIVHEGRSKSYINGQPFPSQKVKELGELLLDIHGQHQHQRLLHHATHREQLDHFAQHDELLQTVLAQHQECLQIKHKIQTMQKKPVTGSKIDELKLIIHELSELKPLVSEMTVLHKEHQLLHHAHDYLLHVESIQQLLSGQNDHDGIGAQLHKLNQSLQQLPQHHPQINNARQLMHNVQIECDEAWDEINHFADSIQIEPERLQHIESRMSMLHQTARKYQQDPNQLHDYLVQLQQEQLQLEQQQGMQAKWQQQYLDACQAYHTASLKLRESRLAHAERLCDAITRVIQQLGMPNGYVTIKHTPLEGMHTHGLDRIEYMVCTNPGLEPDSLAKIASGGELSRISLAIQWVSAERQATSATPTLIFDEVDVGVGGTTAALVGQFLRQLGHHTQVLCVTHQPQVASAAHHHLLVKKTMTGNQTFSHIHPLTAAEKIEEIARMLGGLTITQQTRSHAQALLEEW